MGETPLRRESNRGRSTNWENWEEQTREGKEREREKEPGYRANSSEIGGGKGKAEFVFTQPFSTVF